MTATAPSVGLHWQEFQFMRYQYTQHVVERSHSLYYLMSDQAPLMAVAHSSPRISSGFHKIPDLVLVHRVLGMCCTFHQWQDNMCSPLSWFATFTTLRNFNKSWNHVYSSIFLKKDVSAVSRWPVWLEFALLYFRHQDKLQNIWVPHLHWLKVTQN